MRRTLALFALAWIAATVSSAQAQADEIFLRSGRSFEGRIVKETDTAVTIRFSGGSLTVERYRIERIERDEPDGKKPAPEPKREPLRVGKSRKTKTGAHAPSKDDVREVHDLLAKLRQRTLEAWKDEEPHALEPVDYKRYKVLDTRGALKQTAELPTRPRGIGRVYERRHLTTPKVVAGTTRRSKVAWVRLYWHGSKKQWTSTHPAEVTLVQEDSDVTQILRKIGGLHNSAAVRRCERAVKAVVRKSRQTPPGDASMAQREIREQGRIAGGGGRAGQLVVKAYELSVLSLSADPAGRIQAATRRRVLIREAVALAGF